MGIQALPQTTVRAIGANQALTDPAAVVKELIDNALDALATSVAVEIHSNTLDVIQVKDNGHGIPPQDRPLVARRYCTSKITGTEDLRSIGGSSLGFRGEALASAAELSGGITITTRVEGEQLATLLKISQQGEVVGQERASTPVGSTVRVTDFIKANPVRRQVMLKKTEQCLKKVKQILQAYAFARPHVRLSLRVLKAKNDKGNWMYAPKAGGNAEDAAFKIVGAACASQCTWSDIELHGFTLQALLPKIDAVGERIGGIGAFVSIDSRPVSSQRGTPKQIIKMLRGALKKANPMLDGAKEPFVYLKIVCPGESYDANIEPAKDNVLFEDPENVIEAARQLCSAAYPSSGESARAMSQVQIQSQNAVQDAKRRSDDADDDFVTSLEGTAASHPFRVPKFGDQSSATHQGFHRALIDDDARLNPETGQSDIESRQQARPAFRSNMYGCDEEDLDYLDARPPTGRTEADFEELRAARKDVTVSNPWVMAKLNTKVKPHESTEDLQSTAAAPLVSSRAPVAPMPRVDPSDDGLPTPRPSSPSRPFNPSDHVEDIRLTVDGRVIGSASLPVGRVYATPSQSQAHEDNVTASASSQRRSLPAYDYDMTPASDPAQGSPLSAIPQAGAGARGLPRKRQTYAGGLSIPPITEGPPSEKVWFDHLAGVEDRRKQRPKRSAYQQNASGLVVQGELGDLIEDARLLTPPHRNGDIRDFVGTMDLTADENASSLLERRNFASRKTDQAEQNAANGRVKAAPNTHGAINARSFVPASELAAMEAHMGSFNKLNVPTSPHKRRKTGDRALRRISGNAPPAEQNGQPLRPDTAARAASRRRSSAKVHRSKSSQLPLERTPAGKGTHDLATTVRCSMDSFVAMEQRVDLGLSLLPFNEPAVEAYNAFANEQTDAEMACMADKLRELLINRVCDREMVQDLGDLVKEAFHAYVEKMLQEPVDMSQVDAEEDESLV